MIKFDSLEHLLAILHNSPYAIDGALFFLTRWRPNVSAENIRIQKILVWVRLAGLPMEYFNSMGLNRLAFTVGEVEVVRVGLDNPERSPSAWFLPSPSQRGVGLDLLPVRTNT